MLHKRKQKYCRPRAFASRFIPFYEFFVLEYQGWHYWERSTLYGKWISTIPNQLNCDDWTNSAFTLPTGWVYFRSVSNKITIDKKWDLESLPYFRLYWASCKVMTHFAHLIRIILMRSGENNWPVAFWSHFILIWWVSQFLISSE